jgi:hypothetical protein
MARFFVLVLLGLALAGCNNSSQAASSSVSVDDIPMPIWPEGMVRATPVKGFDMPMPDPKFETNGIGDEIEKIILTDIKKDFKLYRIYEFPTNSSKPEMLYVMSRYTDLTDGFQLLGAPFIESYVSVADKIPMKIQSKNSTRLGMTYNWPGHKVSSYRGDIIGDYNLIWYIYIIETDDYISEMLFLERSKGNFINKQWNEGLMFWHRKIQVEFARAVKKEQKNK